ncbi:MAG: hypothetical protein HY812_19260 [Planctomycetes bacterium]|nr:hypothetical protein [Planctomycetota bacterium]
MARFLQIAGEAWLHAGGLEDARALLEEAACSLEMMHHHPRQRGKLLGTLGEAYRVFGDPRRARALLTEARELSERHGHLGLLADYTYPSLAKLEWRQESGLAWLEKAKALQVDQGNVIGLVRTLLLEARLTGPGQSAEANRVQVDALRRRRPALHRRRCPLLNRILARWRCWVSGGMPEGVTEDFWRL